MRGRDHQRVAWWCVVLLLVGSPAAVALARPAGAAEPAGAAGPAATVRYAPPVPIDVRRAFEAPAHAYGPGHRGVDLAASVGTPVGAAAPGTVRFAGKVVDVTWVTLEHADGLLTTYGPLTDLRVAAGDEVAGGTRLGRLAAGGHGDRDEGLHWSARRGVRYLDPLTLLTPGRPSLVGAGGWHGDAHRVTAYDGWAGGRWGGLLVAPSPVADRPGFAVPPNPNHLVLVGGLNSTSDRLILDAGHLGYDPRSVTALSYAGRTPHAGAPDDPWRDQQPYVGADTWAGVEAASARLADQLRAQWAAEPGRAVDLVGHSMGGVVLWHYLTTHHDAYDPTLPPIGHVVAVGAPLRGSDLAALAGDVDRHGWLGAVTELGRRLLDADGTRTPPPSADAVTQLRPGSPLLDDLADAWTDALERDLAGPLATGTRVLTVAGDRDRVVAARSALPPDPDDWLGTVPDDPRVEHRVLPGDHAGVLDTEALREVLYRFLADEEVVASPGRLPTAVSAEHGDTLRAIGGLVRFHDATGGLRRALRPPPGPVPRR